MELSIHQGELMCKGVLVFNYNEHRPDILLESGVLFGGLHCGNRLILNQDKHSHQIRLEHLDDWICIENDTIVPVPYYRFAYLLY